MRRESDTLQVGTTAPDFTLADSSGATWSLADLQSRAGTELPAPRSDVPAYQGKLLLVFDRGTW